MIYFALQNKLSAASVEFSCNKNSLFKSWISTGYLSKKRMLILINVVCFKNKKRTRYVRAHFSFAKTIKNAWNDQYLNNTYCETVCLIFHSLNEFYLSFKKQFYFDCWKTIIKSIKNQEYKESEKNFKISSNNEKSNIKIPN